MRFGPDFAPLPTECFRSPLFALGVFGRAPLVSRHVFRRADAVARYPGFSPCFSFHTLNTKIIPSAAKADCCRRQSAARLKTCPDTNYSRPSISRSEGSAAIKDLDVCIQICLSSAGCRPATALAEKQKRLVMFDDQPLHQSQWLNENYFFGAIASFAALATRNLTTVFALI